MRTENSLDVIIGRSSVAAAIELVGVGVRLQGCKGRTNRR